MMGALIKSAPTSTVGPLWYNQNSERSVHTRDTIISPISRDASIKASTATRFFMILLSAWFSLHATALAEAEVQKKATEMRTNFSRLNSCPQETGGLLGISTR